MEEPNLPGKDASDDDHDDVSNSEIVMLMFMFDVYDEFDHNYSP